MNSEKKEFNIKDQLYDLLIHDIKEPQIFEIIEIISRLKSGGWISVNDDLKPTKGQKVLVIQNPKTTATKEPLFAIWTGRIFIPPTVTIYADFEAGQSSLVDIIYWQPLPVPPKE